MQLYCGIDLHSNNSMVSLIDDTNKLISEQRLDNNLPAITPPPATLRQQYYRYCD